MTTSAREEPVSQSAQIGRTLVSEWAVCGIAAAASRFIPVPLLDDAVRLRATQIAVVLTLKAHGRSYSSDWVEPLYAGADTGAVGRAREALSYLWSIPRRILFFPIRKYVAIFGSVRGVPTDVMIVLLLGRTAHRCLARGLLTGSDRDALIRQAQSIRRSFDDVVDEMDLRMLIGALGQALSQGRSLASAAVGYAGRTFAGKAIGRDGEGAKAAVHPDGEVGTRAEEVKRVLDRPEISKLLTEFDQRFDAKLAERDKTEQDKAEKDKAKGK